ncbi:MAG: DUF58 domain-containing protein [Propionibacteriaceae bacterium]|jgi:uncharacterized protein (DUF58 family)|nr:DUF58 domain-containing protein [Propionibacteriaceae bacterium]
MAISARVPLLLLLGLIPVAFFPAPGVMLGWVALVAVLCLADRRLAVKPGQFGIKRDLPSSVRRTEQTQSRLTITNPTRRGARFLVRDAWPPSANPTAVSRLHSLGAGESLRHTTSLLPTRRGDLRAAQVTLRSFGPLRLAARQSSLTIPGVLRVLPEFRSRSHLPHRLARLRELDGQAAVHVRGQGTEFDSLREYATGDDVRSIDWRASARALRTMVRTWRPERDRHILIVLDTSRWAAGRLGGQTRLDAGIETCLLLGALGSASGDRMSLLAVDRVVRQRVAGKGWHHGVLTEFANALSQVEPTLVEADWELIAAQTVQLCRQRSLVVLVTGLDPAVYTEGLGTVLPALSRAHQLLIAQVGDPQELARAEDWSSVDAIYDAAAATRLSLASSMLAEKVSRTGVEVVQADPDRLAPAVCDAYLKLKAAARL